MKLRMSDIRRNGPFAVLFLLIPILLLITGWYYRHATGIYFLSTVDPEYAYLFNGMLLANLHPDISYVDHPGTPMMCLIALVSRVVHLFRPGTSLIADVMANPELYIRSSVLTANIICAVALALTGWFVYRRTKQIIPALLLQAIPFVHSLSLEPLSRLIPESLMTAVICLWMILLVDIATQSPIRWKRASLLFGAVYGLSVALKLTFLPYLFIPLLLIQGWRYRFLFLGSTVISFHVFAFPVLFHRIHFVNWVKNILIHTGKYGAGDKGVVDPTEFIEHLQLLKDNNTVLLAASGLLIVAIVVALIMNRLAGNGESFRIRLGIALILTVTFQFVMAAKQFSYHYMLPSIMLTVPMTLLAFILVFEQIRLIRWLALLGPLVALGVICWDLYPKVRDQLRLMEKVNGQRASAYHQYLALKSSLPTVVVCSYYGCSAVEYGLTFGIQVSGKYGESLTERMKNIYPDTYLYYPWGNTFYDGKREISASAFMKPGEYNLLVAGYSDELTRKVTDLLVSDPGNLRIERVYVDTTVSEALFRLQVMPPGQ